MLTSYTESTQKEKEHLTLWNQLLISLLHYVDERDGNKGITPCTLGKKLLFMLIEQENLTEFQEAWNSMDTWFGLLAASLQQKRGLHKMMRHLKTGGCFILTARGNPFQILHNDFEHNMLGIAWNFSGVWEQNMWNWLFSRRQRSLLLMEWEEATWRDAGDWRSGDSQVLCAHNTRVCAACWSWVQRSSPIDLLNVSKSVGDRLEICGGASVRY